MTFVEKYNVNSIIDVLIHGYGFQCHYYYFLKLCYHYYANIHPVVIVVFLIQFLKKSYVLFILFYFSGKLI